MDEPLEILLAVVGLFALGAAWFVIGDMRLALRSFEAKLDRLDRTEPREPFPEEDYPFALPHYEDFQPP